MIFLSKRDTICSAHTAPPKAKKPGNERPFELSLAAFGAKSFFAGAASVSLQLSSAHLGFALRQREIDAGSLART
jgi:hypothetical protein